MAQKNPTNTHSTKLLAEHRILKLTDRKVLSRMVKTCVGKNDK